MDCSSTLEALTAKAIGPLDWHLDCRLDFSDCGSVLYHGLERNGGVLSFKDRLLAHCVCHGDSEEGLDD